MSMAKPFGGIRSWMKVGYAKVRSKESMFSRIMFILFQNYQFLSYTPD